jgi:hypothetical protein
MEDEFAPRPLIEATARVLKNVIDLKVGEESWVARPTGSDEAGLGRRIAALFATEYRAYRATEPETVHSVISYHAKSDEIHIRLGETVVRTRGSAFGPIKFEYGGVAFTINERLTGRFTILNGEVPAAVGQLGFRSCVIREYPADLEVIFADLAIGYVIRTLTTGGLFA